jgi:iron complex outermembrane receptor protein
VGDQLLQASLNRVYVTNKITPDTKSYAVFGQLNWHITERATLTTGVRETYEDKTNTSSKNATFIDGTSLNDLTALGQSLGATPLQIASANNVRTTTIGTLYPTVQGTPIKAYATSWLASPTYKLADGILLYGSAAAGQKSGSVQFGSSGAPANVAPEKVLDFELGIKSLLLHDTLQLNANLFQTRVRDYQQTTSVFDPATTTLKNDGTLYYQSILGNIPEIMARGVELEGTLFLTRHLNLTYGVGTRPRVPMSSTSNRALRFAITPAGRSWRPLGSLRPSASTTPKPCSEGTRLTSGPATSTAVPKTSITTYRAMVCRARTR